MPFVLLGALVSGAIGVFVRDETVARLLPRGRISAPVVGSLLGLHLPRLRVRRRARHAAARSTRARRSGWASHSCFASPVINPIVLWSTYAAFGGDWTMVAWRAGLTFAIAVIVGIVFACHPDARALLKPAPAAMGYTRSRSMRVRRSGHDGIAHATPRDAYRVTKPRPCTQKLRAVCEHSAIEFFEMGKFLVFGASSPRSCSRSCHGRRCWASGNRRSASVLVMVALAVLLSVCSTVDAFLVLTFAGTFTTGAILAFLVFGPMVDIKSTLMFLTVFNGARSP